MKRLFRICLLGTAALAGGHLHAAETAKFRFAAAVYIDANGGGLSLPEGVACGRNGEAIIADTGNNRLLRFTYRDKTVGGGAEIKIPELTSPAAVHVNSTGDIYALDGTQRRLVRLGSSGEFKQVLKFDGAPDAGSVAAKAFALDGADNIYVLDVFGARVLLLDPQGQFQRAIALAAGTGFASDIAVDATGTVFLIDSVKRRLYSAAKEATVFAPLGGELAEFLGTLPTHITAASNILFVVEGSGSTIVTFARDGTFLSRQLMPGWTEGALNHPGQVCINDRDEAFVADRDNSRLQIFQLIR